ncbi:hypothetical protein J2777_002502 [Paraburkholderia graminis]|jgi:hypothetical protein|nr:hypothetical protein [Paraburkholderia graminis]
MCYSAQIQADYRKFVRMFGATMSIREFARLFFERAEGSRTKLPKAMEAAFADPQTDPSEKSRPSLTGSMRTGRRDWSGSCSDIAPGSPKQGSRWRTR